MNIEDNENMKNSRNESFSPNSMTKYNKNSSR